METKSIKNEVMLKVIDIAQQREELKLKLVQLQEQLKAISDQESRLVIELRHLCQNNNVKPPFDILNEGILYNVLTNYHTTRTKPCFVLI
jgi:hypothetical protein